MKTTLLALLFGSVATVALAATSAGTRAPATSDVVTLESQVATCVLPEYPREMLLRNREGFVRLDVVVDPQGRVLAVDVLESSDRAFASVARRAILHWRFIPSKEPLREGHRHVEVPVCFVLPKATVAQR